jgi:hypothetical protein
LGQTADIEWVETINVFAWVDTFKDSGGVKAGREGELNKNAIDGGVGVELVYEVEQLLLSGLGGEIMREGYESYFFTGFSLTPDVNL